MTDQTVSTDRAAPPPSANFEALFAAATQARARAHVPYSGFRVGAALMTADGHIVAGCNVENAAYPQSQCAEATAIGAMVTHGGTESDSGGPRIVEALVIGGEPGDGILCTPCGGCRQRLREFMLLHGPIYVCGPEGLRKTVTLEALLPYSFGPENLG
jgi:cytidine deaminase